ncbi:efflux RND transporter permease subunit [Ehrlichia ruminantium]|uniref:Efflux RND transporter permease subunit n=1 Tax=Ehrlichia ruminantium TaxID=779 RepID=A0AAE6UII5_EHRRU|nr:efflux RND transporter permease subunit [Ehrlichia ruminantium]QGR02539.1 efflux RND transporter permease subunit [Ehrlichia ruminantium]QGR03460.1 efflux RND transporter permease subunit [Ehrlichia ruminantium]QGR04385.1 efflux RND transporter permease subunit [Ehrlichia ruminantium]
MRKISEIFLQRSRVSIFLLIIILIFGSYSYFDVAKEKNPEIKKPILSVHTVLQGMSSEDIEKLIIYPIEQEVMSIKGVTKVTSVAKNGYANVILEFSTGFDNKEALDNVRSKIDIIRSKLPQEATFPIVSEENLGLLPVLNIALMGDIPDRALFNVAENLQSRLEELPNVQSVKIVGNRKDSLEINISPDAINIYNLQVHEVVNAVLNHNQFINAGNLDIVSGKYTLYLSGLLKNIQDVMHIPIKTDGYSVVTLGDVATVKLVYQDGKELVRINGKPSLVLEVSKQPGKNILETISQLKDLIRDTKSVLPQNLSIVYLQDQSEEISDILNELQNSIVISVLLVVIIMMIFMGTKTALLVAISIPGSFLLGIIVMYLLGYTLNIVILFSLIMAIGMLVDDAIVVTEYADRKMISGLNRKEAFKQAAYDMFWPVASATLTKLVVYIPLLLWPGTTGEFMKYIPIALITTLTASWVMALIFIPVLGSILGKPSVVDRESVVKITAIETGKFINLGRFSRGYVNILTKVLDHPKKFVCMVIGILVLSTLGYFIIGPGIEFFPNIEPDRIFITIKSNNNLSVVERDNILQEIEQKISNVKGIKFIYVKVGLFEYLLDENNVIGKIQLELKNWFLRRRSKKILSEIIGKLGDVKGVIIDVLEERMKPVTGKPIRIDISSYNVSKISSVADRIVSMMKNLPGFKNVTDNRSSSEIEWKIDVDKNKAAKFGVDISMINQFVKMIAGGIILNKYHADNVNDEVDILLRFPKEYRNLKTIDNFFVNTVHGYTSISDFVTYKAQHKENVVNRINGKRTVSVVADLANGYLLDDMVNFLNKELKKEIDPEVLVEMRGEIQDQKESLKFLIEAFVIIVVLIMLVLVAEFNSFYDTLIIMTAIFLSTTCVFFGFFITHHVFSVVMSGVGIIVLAGVIVNNNILLIDAFYTNINSISDKKEAIIRAAISRLRPILLTVVTGIIGLLPMVLRVSFDFINQKIIYDSPSSQLWCELSYTISLGLLLATVITLFFTPALLVLRKCNKIKKSYEMGCC